MEKSIAYFLYQKEGDLMYNFNYYTPTKVVLGYVENWEKNRDVRK